MSTITPTLELPDHLAARLAAMDPERQQRFAVASLERDEAEGGLPSLLLSPQGAAAVNAALGAAESGAERVLDFDVERRRALGLIQRAAS